MRFAKKNVCESPWRTGTRRPGSGRRRARLQHATDKTKTGGYVRESRRTRSDVRTRPREESPQLFFYESFRISQRVIKPVRH